MNITIEHVKNANELDEFHPVEGGWYVREASDEDTVQDVVESVKNWMDADYPISVEVFHADGRVITGDLPSNGTFIATRQ